MSGATEDAASLTAGLRADAAPPSAWRQRALELHKDGQQQDSVKVLEESMDAFKEPQFLGDSPEVSADKSDTMHMLISAYLMQFLSRAQDVGNGTTEESLKAPLTRASNLLDQVSKIDGDSAPTMRMLDLFVNSGFHALTQHKLRHSGGESHELTRANLFFNSALQLDSNSPQAIFGKAAVFIHWREWQKALTLLRQIIHRRPRADMMKEVKFAVAMCFCGMERFDQMRNALMGVLEVDPQDVETLCALAQLDAYMNARKENVDDNSGAYLEKAWTLNQAHPVVLLSAAHSAFLVGMEMQSEERLNPNGPWATCRELLQRVLEKTPVGPTKAEAHYQLGRLKHAQELFQEAYEEYSKCRQLSPEHSLCLYGFAQTCVELRHLQEAITALETLRKKHGDSRDALKLLTFVQLQTQHREAAATAKALCALPVCNADVEAWSMLAEAHEQRYVAGNEEATKDAYDAYSHVGKILEAGDIEDQANPQMWNNLGTLRGLEGDAEGAKRAYATAMTLIEKHGGKQNSEDESKDLHVTELTVRFNRAWLAETVEQPDNLEAMSDLLKLREEVSWFADSTLRLGSKWAIIGDLDRAVQTYGEASKQSPVLVAVMQSQAYKRQGEFVKALKAAEKAVEKATPKQFHYVHVYFGNLYFECSQEPQFKSNADRFLRKALWHFMQAFKNAKDSHYAAVGIGMVFAQRGQLEFAKRTFQSVLQHTRGAATGNEDPSVFINLAHTYVQYGGNEARKAIALYEKARKLRPDDVSIRQYLARAHFELMEFDRCAGILSDALSFWPDDIVLRYNLAITLENLGMNLVLEEKKIDRVVGHNSGKDKMERAVAVLQSAANHFAQIYNRWGQMSKEVQMATAKSSPNAAKFMTDMKNAAMHQEYCQDVTDKANEELQVLKEKRDELDAKVAAIAAEKKRQAEMEANEKKSEEEHNQERRREIEEQAINLMEKTQDIELGKNIGDKPEQKAPAAKAPKEKSMIEHLQKHREPIMDEDGNPVEPAPKAKGKARAKKLSKKEKKAMKKAAKKEKKKRKKEGRGDDSSEEPAVDPDVPTHSIPTEEKVPTQELPAGDDEQDAPGAPVLPVQDTKMDDSAKMDELFSEAESGGDADERKKAKKQKKQDKKAAKKAKKEAKKKDKKRKRGEESGDDEEAAAEDKQQNDAQMEAELFGSDDD